MHPNLVFVIFATQILFAMVDNKPGPFVSREDGEVYINAVLRTLFFVSLLPASACTMLPSAHKVSTFVSLVSDFGALHKATQTGRG